jgi:hypothetical protein
VIFRFQSLTCSSIADAASGSALVLDCVTQAATTSPFRFSLLISFRFASLVQNAIPHRLFPQAV